LSLASANETPEAEPRPVSVTLPPKVKRKTHFLAPLGATTNHNPPPSPCRPALAVAIRRADNLPMVLQSVLQYGADLGAQWRLVENNSTINRLESQRVCG
jgi:hypothetical protein